MSKECIKCGHPLPDNASFCPHCTAVQMEKKRSKAPEKVEKESAYGSGNTGCSCCSGDVDFSASQTTDL